ncbi:MAG: DUF1801 domain-containing protein [Weeksellaceae bacterium]|nr:DUF1801 domain-containing protein [Weeksellaceae bacterium]
MRIEAEHVADYLSKVPDERKPAMQKLYETVKENLPEGFEEGVSYGMMGWNVPLENYPNGYHCTPGEPLPFMGMASQKNFIAFYHMGMYADKELHDWFVSEYPKHSKRKLDMGKSCIRFKKPDEIPLELMGELVKKMSAKDWISIYEQNLKK